MANKELKKLFQTAKQECQPNNDWVNDTRALILSQVHNEIPEQNVPFLMKFAEHLVPANLAFKPVAVFSLILGLVLISSFGSINAAQNTLPGDTLYPIKITAENVKYNLSFTQEQKAKTAMGMVEKRVGELKVIVEKEDNEEREYKVAQTTQKIKNSLNIVKDKVPIIGGEAVKEIDEKLAVMKDEIIQASGERIEGMENKMADELAQVVEQIKEASDVVMAALTEQENKGGEVKGEEDNKLTENLTEEQSPTSTPVEDIEEPMVTTTPEVILPAIDVKEALGIKDENIEEKPEEFKVNIGE